jgi:hypothetical protein
VLLVGDSAQGKSEASIRLSQHYRLGERVESKNATVAGLLGGLEKHNDKWFVKWGVLPKHDRRLVFIEEMKGMERNTLSKLTDTRSSGIAELPKIERRRTYSRTRLVGISNPPKRNIAAYSFGIDAIRDLIPAMEDIRRFDACMILGEKEVSKETRDKSKQLMYESPKYSSDLCRHLVLRAWTMDEVLVSDKVWSVICEYADKLTAQFCEDVPIVDKGSIRHKLARLAISLANRVYSIDESGSVAILSVHIEYVYNLLVRVYTKRVFGYDRYTQSLKQRSTLKKPDQLKTEISAVPNLQDFLECVLHTENISDQDLADWCN